MKISIIGAAGYVGSNVTTTLAMQGLADELILIDPYKENLALHLAMDTGTAAAEMGVSVKAGDYAEMRDSNVVIIAAGAPQGLIKSRMEMLPANLPIIKDLALKIKEYCPGAIVITATNPVDPLNYAMYRFTGFDRSKIIGYSSNDSIRFRMMVAKALGQQAADVEGFVLGEHGESQVQVFTSVRVKGQPVKLDSAFKDRIRARVPEILRGYEELRTGRTAGVTSGAGMGRIIEAIVDNTGDIIACSAVLDGEYGLTSMSMGAPLALGSGGIHEVVELEIAPDEKPYLETTVGVLTPVMRQVDDFVNK